MSEITTSLEILRTPNESVTIEEGQEIIKLLEKSLVSSPVKGVGLAAPQISINKKVAIIRAEENIDLINPRIIDRKQPFINFAEGCLSVPGKIFDTQRYREIFVKDDLHPEGFVAVGFTAVVIEHEIDHLDSILVMDRSIGTGKIGRNDPCPCGKKNDGRPIKWKKCHGKI